jgi:hypothetical protein
LAAVQTADQGQPAAEHDRGPTLDLGRIEAVSAGAAAAQRPP